MKITKRAFREAVEAAVSSRRLSEAPITVRTVIVDFENRAITIDGRRIEVTTPAFAFPILSTEIPLIVRDDRAREGIW